MPAILFHASREGDPRNGVKFTTLIREFIRARGSLGASTQEIANYLSNGGAQMITVDRAEATMRTIERQLPIRIQKLGRTGHNYYTAQVGQ
jgi:hypothetical protein